MPPVCCEADIWMHEFAKRAGTSTVEASGYMWMLLRRERRLAVLRKRTVMVLLFQRDSGKLVRSAVNSTAAFGELVEHGRDPKRLCGRFEKKFPILCGATLACLLEAFARVFTKMICLVHSAALCPTL